MRKLAHCLVVLAVAGHVGLTVVDAYARGGGGGGGGGGHGFGGATHFNAPSSFNSDRYNQAPVGVVVTSPRGPTEGGGTKGGQYPNGNGDGDGYRPPPRQGHHGFGPAGFDEPDSSDGGGGGGGGECAGGLQLTEIDSYTDPIDGLTKISSETEHYISACGGNAQTRIADALDRYAQALTAIAPRLPPTLHSLPQIVAAAAHRARTAPTKHAAAHALLAAVVAIHAAVHKTISLIRASDPDATSVATRGGDLVAKTLSVAASALERADSL
jgi:hypothetical protein